MIPLPTSPVPYKADAVIVGGGINGLAAATELARLGMKDIVVLEKSYLGSGSTGRCGGGIRQVWTSRENVMLARESVAIYRNLAGELGLQTFFRQGGYLLVTEDEAQLDLLHRSVKLQNECGVPTRFLQPAECRDLVPELKVDRLAGAAFCPEDGTAYPFSVAWGYARAARRLGVRIFIRTELHDVLRDGDRITGVRTSRGDIAAPLLINCAGPWARSLAAKVGVELPNRQERHEIMVSEPCKPFMDPMVISLANGIYFSQSMRGEIVGGIGEPGEPHWSEPGDFDTRSQLRFAVTFAKALIGYYPPAARMRLMRQWAGMYDVTPDHRPILGGVPGLDGYHHICGFSGHGFMLAPVAAKRMARRIVSGEDDPIIASLSLSRFDGRELEVDAFVVG